ncbi:MAG: HEAT repeat domain-containing protein, partial [Candidatus Aminicenantes bacterium]|nr:HEAT repeat domain-containing protein [Candidatus Aminicenantes bacterium]
PDVQNELIKSIAERRIQEGMELLLARARSSDSGNRLEAIKAVKDIASLADLPRLVELLLSTKEERDQLELASTIAVVAGKNPQPVGRARAVVEAMSQTEDIPKRCSLFRALGKIGDDSSLPVLREALAESNPELKDAAVRALADWPTPTPREDLLQVARTTTNSVHRILALRAFIQMVGMEPYRSPRMAVRSLQEVLDLSRPEEKKLILGILPTFAGPEALAVAESLLKEKEVKAEAELAIKKIKERLKK